MTRMLVLVINPGMMLVPQVLPTVSQDQPYEVTLEVMDEQPPVKLRIVSGVLPTGLTFTDNGDGTATIAGTTSAEGFFDITIQFEDVRQDPRQHTYRMQVAVVPVPPVPVEVTGTAPAGVVGVPYSYQFGATGGVAGPKTFGYTGTLPPGISLDTAGLMSGTPTTDSGSPFAFTVTATDGEGNVSAGSAQSVAVTAGDPFFASNKFLLPLTGTDGSTTITDVIGGTWTAFGNAQIDTSDSDFPGGALLLDGTGDYIKSGTIAGLAVGTGPFTIEFFIELNSSTPNNQYFFDTSSGNRTAVCLAFGRLAYYDPNTGTGGALYLSGPTAASLVGTRAHIAVSRSAGGTVRAFLNGVMWGSQTVTAHNKTDTVAVIGRYEPGASNYANARISPTRFAADCRYTANFTPPSVPFPTS